MVGIVSLIGFFISHVLLLRINIPKQLVLMHAKEGNAREAARRRRHQGERRSWTPVIDTIQNDTKRASLMIRPCTRKNERATTTTTANVSLRWTNDLRHCNNSYPPPTECQETNYSILLWFDVASAASANETATTLLYRTLFVNLMYYLTFPHVQTIHVLLLGVGVGDHHDIDDDVMVMLQRDVKYGRRILQWHLDETHKVTLVSLGTRDSSSSFRSPPVSLLGSSDATAASAMLVLDGSVLFSNDDDNQYELGFDVWKRHADALITTRTWPLYVPEGPSLSSSSSLPSSKMHNNTIDMQQQHSFGFDESDHEGHHSLVALCNDESIVFATDVNDKPKKESPHLLHLVDLSGLWVHVDFLACVLQHSQLLVKSKTSNANDVVLSLSLLLMYVAQSPPLVYFNSSSFDDDRSTKRWIGDNGSLTRLVHEHFGGMLPATTPVPCPPPGSNCTNTRRQQQTLDPC